MDEVKMRDAYFAFYRWELKQGRVTVVAKVTLGVCGIAS